MTASIVAAILLAAVVYRLAGELAFAPCFASPDAGDVVRAYFTARQWGYRGLAERALAPGVPDRLHAPHAGRPLIDDTFLPSALAVSAPQDIPLYGEYAEELQFVVTYRRGGARSPARRPAHAVGSHVIAHWKPVIIWPTTEIRGGNRG